MKLKEKFYKKSVGKAIEIDGETIYLKKTGFLKFSRDWQKINPPVSIINKDLEPTEDNLKWNYLNLFVGGKKNLITLILIFLLLSVAYYEIGNLLGDAKEYMEGDKYVIMTREAFNTFCQYSVTISGGDYYNQGIITNITNWSLDLGE